MNSRWLALMIVSFSFFSNGTESRGQEMPLSESAIALPHSPDEEAEEIRQARISELMDRVSSQDGFQAVAPGSPSTHIQGTNRCRHVSDITAPPPFMRVALTFDDGPDKNGTPYILEVLRKYHIRATFFMIGRAAAERPELVDRVVGAGHLLIGNHSWSHPDFHSIPVSAQLREISQNMALLGKYEVPKFFRFPFGDSTCESKNYAHSLGYKLVGWHVDSCDWAFNRTGAVDNRDARICGVLPQNRNNFLGHIVEQLHSRKGGILLMHEIQPNTIRKLDLLIQELVHEGFSFGTIDEPGFAASMQ